MVDEKAILASVFFIINALTKLPNVVVTSKAIKDLQYFGSRARNFISSIIPTVEYRDDLERLGSFTLYCPNPGISQSQTETCASVNHVLRNCA